MCRYTVTVYACVSSNLTHAQCSPALQAPPLSDVLRRIELHRVYDVHEVSASLDALAARWASPETTATVAPVKQQGVPSAAAGGRLDSQLPGLVIVDSVSAAIAPVYGRPMQGSEGGTPADDLHPFSRICTSEHTELIRRRMQQQMAGSGGSPH